MQETLMTIFEKLPETEFESSFASWANNILEFKISNYIRSKKRRANKMALISNEKKEQSSLSFTPDPDLKRRLLSCLKKIGKSNIRYARILNLSYQGYNAAEICEKLKITLSNFYVILSRSRSILELCLETGRIK